MRISWPQLMVVSTAGLLSCFDVHDNPTTANTYVNDTHVDATADSDVDTNHVQPTQNVGITMTVQNVYLIDPSKTPPPEHANDAGHIQIYLDDFDGTPLVITANLHTEVVIPAASSAGPHRLRCRVHKHDGTPTTAVADVSITIVIGGATDGGTGTPDAGGGHPDGG